MKYLGDIIIVEHIGKNFDTKRILVPDDINSKCGGILARVIEIGYIPLHRRKKKRYYPQDELKINDIVIVTEQFGSRNRIKTNSNAIIYDSEDVHARVFGYKEASIL